MEKYMYKMVAIFKVPSDVESFDKYYQEIHTPITKKVPGIKEFRVSKVFGTPRGKSDLHLITELIFATKEDFKAALNSPEMMASGKDTSNFAKDLISVHFAEEKLV
jgi:uncharacterized protein (TIGR02118 family)